MLSLRILHNALPRLGSSGVMARATRVADRGSAPCTIGPGCTWGGTGPYAARL